MSIVKKREKNPQVKYNSILGLYLIQQEYSTVIIVVQVNV